VFIEMEKFAVVIRLQIESTDVRV